MRSVFATLALAAALLVSFPAWAADPVYTGYFSSTALDGYDAPVNEDQEDEDGKR